MLQKLNNRTVWLVAGSLGVLGVGASAAAAGVGPFTTTPPAQDQESWDGVQLEQTPGSSIGPATVSAGSAVSAVTAISAVSAQSAQSAASAVSPASPMTPPSPKSAQSAKSAPSA